MPTKIKAITEDAAHAQGVAQKALGVAVAQAKQIEDQEEKLRRIHEKLTVREKP